MLLKVYLSESELSLTFVELKCFENIWHFFMIKFIIMQKFEAPCVLAYLIQGLSYVTSSLSPNVMTGHLVEDDNHSKTNTSDQRELPPLTNFAHARSKIVIYPLKLPLKSESYTICQHQPYFLKSRMSRESSVHKYF